MPRYIDADAVEKRIVDYYDAQLQSFPSSKGEEKRLLLGGINYGRNVVRDAPTADVVPKSEVERLEKEVEQLRNNNDYLIKEAAFAPMERAHTIIAVRQEVAREIFKEIKREFNGAYYYKGYTIERYIAELKKKYTEEKE